MNICILSMHRIHIIHVFITLYDLYVHIGMHAQIILVKGEVIKNI